MSDPTPRDLPDEEDAADVNTGTGDVEEKQSRLDRFRGTGVGVEDPNIAGDTSTPDVEPDMPPGRDPETGPPGA